ncbi:MAG: hypothetical protein GQ477_04020 [Nanohaloarchaea archaeon]|nr:hypothetical protein [Candidatus Nanohaloarchaea archaeon]
MNNKKYLDELKFCLKLWDTESGCTFGKRTDCKDCAVPYLLLKFISGEVLHGNMKRLTLDDWKNKYNSLKD